MVLEAELHPSEPETKDGVGGGGDKHVEDVGLEAVGLEGNCSHSPTSCSGYSCPRGRGRDNGGQHPI